MADKLEFRTKFTTEDSDEQLANIEQFVRGEAPGMNPMLFEHTTQAEMDTLAQKALETLLERPNNVFRRQPWLFHASNARDFKTGKYRRTKLKAIALSSLYMENFGVGKIAADAMNSN